MFSCLLYSVHTARAVFLLLMHMEQPVSLRQVIWNRSIWMTLLDNNGYSFWCYTKTWQLLAALKLLACALWVNFFCCSVTLKSIDLISIWNDSFNIWFCSIDSQLFWKYCSLSYSYLPNVDIFCFTIPKIPYSGITSNLIKKAFTYQTVLKLKVLDTHFPKFWFSLEGSNFIIGYKYCQFFPLDWKALFTLKNMPVKYPVLNNTACLRVILMNKYDISMGKGS